MHKEIEYLTKYLPTDKLEEGLSRLEKGEAVQYIVGTVNFYGNELVVNPSVLIPRFETEELVYKTASYIQKYFEKPVRIADIGTGSGCIAIALKKKLEGAIIDAVDISLEALFVARENARKNDVEIKFLEGNLLDPLIGPYDVLISNPPYIDSSEEVMEVVRENEPHLALYADHNGLACYEEILGKASCILSSKNLIAFEIGELQGSMVKDLALHFFPKAKVTIEKDMQGRDRFVFIWNQE